MKSVTVTFFAAFRDQAGKDQETLQTNAATVGELFEEVAARLSGLESYSRMKFAVNDEMVRADHAVADGDEVLFFPPVAGG
jgi:molybdopterin converting factor subunit 1